MLVPKPSIGQIVHYVLDTNTSGPIVRPAIVVDAAPSSQTVDLQVFTNGNRDQTRLRPHEVPGSQGGGAFAANVVPRMDVSYDEERRVGTWHWPRA